MVLCLVLHFFQRVYILSGVSVIKNKRLNSGIKHLLKWNLNRLILY